MMRFRGNQYEYKTTVKFKDRNEAYHFAKLLDSFSSFLYCYAYHFDGDKETPEMIDDVGTQILRDVIYENHHATER